MYNKKIIPVSEDGQITIPNSFYEKLNLKKNMKMECFYHKNTIILKPVKNQSDNFSVEILRDLISEGYSGNELIEKFQERTEDLKDAIEDLLNKADQIASGELKGYTIEDVFGDEYKIF
jgi:bifunctional DNA-binding transcriptional regulator/antitoxin component of YhaV-PrlF toxin-antitoxin module